MGLQPYKPRRQRDQKPTGRRLSPQEVKKLRAIVDTTALKGKRDLAILDMMLFAGLRRAEVCSLTGDSLQQQDGRFWLTIQGKGNKTRRLKVHDVLYQSLAEWLAAANKLQSKDTSPPHPIPSTPHVFEGMTRHGRLTGNALTGATIGRIVAEYGHAAGLAPASGANALAPSRFTPYLLPERLRQRRTAAQNPAVLRPCQYRNHHALHWL